MSSSSPTPVQRDLRELDAAWDDFFSAVRRARGRAARQHGVELTLPQLHLLDAIEAVPDARCGAIAEAVGIAPPTASRMIDGLERQGIVERRASSDDRRAIDIEITERGRELHERKRALVSSKRAELFGSLSRAERKSAEHLLRRLAEVIDEL